MYLLVRSVSTYILKQILINFNIYIHLYFKKKKMLLRTYRLIL